jgi:hypothetical protein
MMMPIADCRTKAVLTCSIECGVCATRNLFGKVFGEDCEAQHGRRSCCCDDGPIEQPVTSCQRKFVVKPLRRRRFATVPRRSTAMQTAIAIALKGWTTAARSIERRGAMVSPKDPAATRRSRRTQRIAERCAKTPVSIRRPTGLRWTPYRLGCRESDQARQSGRAGRPAPTSLPHSKMAAPPNHLDEEHCGCGR